MSLINNETTRTLAVVIPSLAAAFGPPAAGIAMSENVVEGIGVASMISLASFPAVIGALFYNGERISNYISEVEAQVSTPTPTNGMS